MKLISDDEYYEFCKARIRKKRDYLRMLIFGQIPPEETAEKIRKQRIKGFTYEDFVYDAAVIDFYVQKGVQGKGGWETADEVSDFLIYDSICEEADALAKTMFTILSGLADAPGGFEENNV